MKTFGDISSFHKGVTSGFDYLRIALSVLVVLWHSYPITYGGPAASKIFLSNFGIFIHLILPMFFALSGFLVCSSLIRTKDIFQFLAFRAIRIFPALIVEVMVSALILGPILTTYAITDYLRAGEFYSYLLNIFGYIHYNLPGVFENNPVARAVNISLWTVPYELECYIALAIIAVLGFSEKKLFPIAFFSIYLILVFQGIINGKPGYDKSFVNGRVLVICFLAGVGFYLYRSAVPYSREMALTAFVVSILCSSNPYLMFLCPVPVAYLTVYLGLMNPGRSKMLFSGDYSYGIYLYAAPMQQTFAYLLGSSNAWLPNFVYSLVAACIIAVFSWHLIEKPFLRLKIFIPNLQIYSLNFGNIKRKAR